MAERLPSAIDRSLKALVRRVPTAFLRLAGVEVAPEDVRAEDVTINLPEFRADQVLILRRDGSRRREAVHFEFQLRPKAEVLPDWFFKNAALTRQLGLPVALLAIYLERSRYRTFPSAYRADAGRLSTGFTFDTLRLWEHKDRIRGGELAELAPLLVLCDNNPVEETLQEERRLILGLNVPRRTQSDLLAVAVTVGARFFAHEIVLQHFREELQMLKESSIVEQWVAEAEEAASVKALAQGRVEGRVEQAREILLQLLRARFGDLPTSVVDRVNRESADWCREVTLRLLTAKSLEELGF